VWGWGRNSNGYLGTTYKDTEPCMDGATASDCARLPTQVQGITGATHLAAGGGHACALVAGGQVRCWGNNSMGACGDGTTTIRFGAVDVLTEAGTPLTGMTRLAAGWGHNCASDGTLVRCWGRNDLYQVGNGGTTTALRATNGLTLSNRWPTLGSQFSCVVTATGAQCWGANSNGQLGIGNYENYRSSPVPVTSIMAVRLMNAFGDGACVVRDNGEVACWGRNQFGQLGNDSFDNSAVPVPVLW
jgi:alpha-tubulin suppressor-like RCC1 family protein